MEYEQDFENTEAEDAVEGVIRDLPMILGGIVILSLLYAGYNLFNTKAGQAFSDAFGSAMSAAAEILNHPFKYLILYLVAQLLYVIGPWILSAALEGRNFLPALREYNRERRFGVEVARRMNGQLHEMERKGGYTVEGRKLTVEESTELLQASAKQEVVRNDVLTQRDGNLYVEVNGVSVEVKIDPVNGLEPKSKMDEANREKFDEMKTKFENGNKQFDDAMKKLELPVEREYSKTGVRVIKNIRF